MDTVESHAWLQDSSLSGMCSATPPTELTRNCGRFFDGLMTHPHRLLDSHDIYLEPVGEER
jgi:hypothetical protein